MKIAEIEENVRQLLLKLNKKNFLYDLLLAYGKPKASIKRLEAVGAGGYNLSKKAGVVLWKKQVLYTTTAVKDLESVVDELLDSEGASKHAPRFVMATNFDRLYAVDTKTEDVLDITFVELQKNFDFFLPWAGMEKAQNATDNPADVKAAEKMAKLFDLIKADNPASDAKSVHSLNVFLSRLLFCFFAEDTGIFTDKLFSNSVESHTSKDGDDLQEYLQKLFKVLDTEDRSKYPAYLQAFPYVNGGLLAETHSVPKFSVKSRAILIECGADLNWSEINPDIFGSMIQAVVDVEQRGNMGMHYTSVVNIMKVIEPLFLDALYADFEKSKDSARKLQALLQKIEKLRIFDPACGSGNFLIIAYRELRKLEIHLLQQLKLISPQMEIPFSRIKLSQFYGIELLDFPHEIAILSLWLAEHQMNVAFKAVFGRVKPALPLQRGGNIVCKNSNTTDWKSVCPLEEGSAVYVLGNPPYLGARTQSPDQKAEMRNILTHVPGANSLDYISAWFVKAADYIKSGAQAAAFVSTSSITQGEQVALLWPHILEGMRMEIGFAHTSFKWTNNAKNAAGVSCVIIGLRKICSDKCRLFNDAFYKDVNNISPYLTDSKNIYVHKRSTPLSQLPEMAYGNQAIDGGFLTLDSSDRDEILSENPLSVAFIRKLVGGNEFLKGLDRWCIWIEDEDLTKAEAIAPIRRRIAEVKRFRKAGGQVASSLVDRSHQFRYRHKADRSFLLIPQTSSERRKYLQVGYYSSDYLTTHSAQIVYDADLFVFGILSSNTHMVWAKAVGGTLESRLRYSIALCYNNFPIPNLSEKNKQALRSASMKILAVRENYSEFTISDLYAPERMPSDLLRAHEELDSAMNRCYGKQDFIDDVDQLSYLFRVYEEMTEKKRA
jgi:hypothetical protein